MTAARIFGETQKRSRSEQQFDMAVRSGFNGVASPGLLVQVHIGFTLNRVDESSLWAAHEPFEFLRNFHRELCSLVSATGICDLPTCA